MFTVLNTMLIVVGSLDNAIGLVKVSVETGLPLIWRAAMIPEPFFIRSLIPSQTIKMCWIRKEKRYCIE